MIPVGRLAPKDQWDQTLLDDLFANRLAPTGMEFKRVEGYPHTDGCCLLIPARYWHQHTDQISEAIQRYDWCLAFRCGDEEDLFDITRVEHPNVKWWVQTPRRDYPADVRLFGVGYSPHFQNLPPDPPVKDVDVFLAAQRTNGRPGRDFRVYERRAAWFKALKHGPWSKQLMERDGFAQGDRAEYVSGMLSAKIAPAPTGMVTVDSFRFWEALEAGCAPIADGVSDVDGPTDYWTRVLGNHPIPVVTELADLPNIVDEVLSDWPAIADRIAAWYRGYKQSLATWLRDDLKALGAI